MSFLVAIIGFGLLVLVHEAGHFFTARAVGMRPRKFYVGFPPPLVKTVRNGIEYGIGTIPLGGYVKIPGMHRPAAADLDHHFARALEEAPWLAGELEPVRHALASGNLDAAARSLPEVQRALVGVRLSEAASRQVEKGLQEIADALSPEAYWRARTWKRVAVIFAGPAANVVLAFFLFAGAYLSLSDTYRLGFSLSADRTGTTVTAVVHDVRPSEPAGAMGLRAGDRIVAIDGTSIGAPDQIPALIRASAGRPVTLTIVRGAQKLSLGPASARRISSPGVGESAWLSLRATGWVTTETGKTLGRLFTGAGEGQVSSVVGTVQASEQAASRGTADFLWILGVISLSLALLNLLPLLPLDGGHIAFSLVEGVRRRAVRREVYERVSIIGIGLVLMLFFIGLSNDVQRLGG